METTNTLITHIKEMALTSGHRQITGSAALARNLFQFLCAQSEPPTKLMLFCRQDGLVLHCNAAALGDEIAGHTLNLTELGKYDELHFFREAEDYIIISLCSHQESAAVARIQKDLVNLLEMISKDENNSRHLLHCLNSVKNAISIYDENATLLYANTSFCKDLSIPNLEDALGRNINDVIRDIGAKVHSMEDNSSSLKMMDVLKNGEEVIDWEVRIEPVASGEESKLVSNDMYPVLDDAGKVRGMVELTHSRQQDIKRTRKIMGFAAEYTFHDIVGASKAIKEKIRTAKEYASSPFNFLITGESGVGKELFAQSIHNYSPRRKGPFVALNCANFSDGLIESELFGYVGGAFTGASKNGQIGKFELADGGTLFLDEVGELPLHFQSKLLRVLETWMVTRIGSSKQIPVNVRLITATNRNLAEMVEEGLFRQDLYYRLQVLTLEIPPLRDRKDDLVLLSDTFLSQAAAPYRDTPKILSSQAKKILMSYDWPGNVRELRNVITRATVLSKSKIISKEILEESIASKGYMLKAISTDTPAERVKQKLAEIDNAYASLLKEALELTAGNKKEAAELIGVSRNTFYRMLEKYNDN